MHSKETINKMKRQPTEWKKIFLNNMIGKGVICKIYNSSYNSTSETQTTHKKMSRRRKLEKATAPHSRTLAWKIPWTEEPGRLQSMASLRVGHN